MSDHIADRVFAVRLYVMAAIFALILVGLAVRLFDVQILQHRHLAGMAERQHQKTIEVHGKRGTIYDRRMRALGLSVDRESLYLNPNELTNRSEAIASLAQALAISETIITEKLASDRQFVWLKRRVTPQEAGAVRALGLKGIGYVTESQRFYPKHGLAGHVMGFVGMDEGGLEGLEHSYDSLLAGQSGHVLLDRDAHGRPISLRPEHLRALPRGHDLVLTLDERLQFIAERELRAQVAKVGARGGVAMVMDPSTGEILALANDALFDPNRFREVSSKVWRERGITDTFEPGSTMKALLAAAAFEERLVRPDDMFYGEQGGLQVATVMMRDHEKFGWLTFREVLEKSSNVGAIKVAQRLGKERFYAYLARFGLGSRTGIDFPGEAHGVLRPPQQWSELSLASLSIGQELAVTPLQLLVAFSALGNGGVLMRPHLLKAVLKDGEVVQEVRPAPVARVVSEATAQQVTALLQGVVLRGTGKGAAIEGYSVAGKTGTAQKYDPGLGKYSAQKTTASFVGYLPAQQPRVAILVSLDEPEPEMAWGSVAAAPVFRTIGEHAMRMLRVPPEDRQARLADRPLTVAVGQSFPDAPLPTISARHFVENMRHLMRDTLDQIAISIWDRFFTIDPKEARKSRKKEEGPDR
jgi:cell division protein FtsI (penicillin-binding protein 3)